MDREWQKRAQLFTQQLSSESEIEREVVWIQETVTEILNKYASPVRISPQSKRWWNETVKKARKGFLRGRYCYGRGRISWEELKATRNAYYSTIRREKRLTWQRFLQGEGEEEEGKNQEGKGAEGEDRGDKRGRRDREDRGGKGNQEREQGR